MSSNVQPAQNHQVSNYIVPTPQHHANFGTTFKVGHLVDWQPFWFGHPVSPNRRGFDYDVVEAVVARTPLPPPTYIAYETFEELFAAFANEEIDVMVNNVWKIKERASFNLYSIPYYLAGGLGAMFYKCSPTQYYTIPDLAHKRVGKLAADTVDWFGPTRARIGQFVLFPDAQTMIRGLEQDKCDVILSEVSFFDHLTSTTKPELRSTLILPVQTVILSTFSHCDLINQFNIAIESMWNDGTLYELQRRYFALHRITPADFDPFKFARDNP
jgi:ABC-type amino acid transport substrate-binding protein